MSRPWERRPNESESAYRAFLAYRDLGESRTIDGVHGARPDRDRIKSKRSSMLLGWSTTHNWIDRCRAWDNHCQAEIDKAALAERKKWEARRLRNNERNFELGEQLRDRALALLKFPVARQRSEDGTTIVEPAKWTQRDLAVMLKTASELAGTALKDVGMTVATEKPATTEPADAGIELLLDAARAGLAHLSPEDQATALAGMARAFRERRLARDAESAEGGRDNNKILELIAHGVAELPEEIQWQVKERIGRKLLGMPEQPQLAE